MPALDRLLETIYRSVLDEDFWKQTLPVVASAFEATSACIFVNEGVESLETQALNLPGDVMVEYLSRAPQVDLWYQELSRRGAFARSFVYRAEELVQTRTLRRSEFYANYLRPCEIETTMGGLTNGGNIDDPSCISLYRARGRGAFSAEDAETLNRLRPHLLQVRRIRIALMAARAEGALRAVEGMKIPLLLLGSDGRCLAVSAAVHRTLNRFPQVKLVDGHVVSKMRNVRFELEAATRAIVERSKYHVLVRIEGAAPDGLVLAVTPPPDAFPSAPSVAAIAFLREESRAARMEPETLRSLYGLTTMEARLACALAGGERIEAFAKRRAVTIATARTHLKHVFEKTCVNSQASLVRLIASISIEAF